MMQDSPATILTVEDDPVVRDSIAIWLEDAGFSVLEADNGLTGLEQFREKKPDAVLLDLGIPGIEGSKLLQMISGESPDTPVIIVSGRADIDDAIVAFKSGAWDYITKPIVNMDMLEKTVRNCLEHKRLKERVTAAENRYYALVQNLPMVVFAMNSNLELSFINATSTQVLGHTPETVLASPNWFLDHIPEKDKSRVQQAVQAAFASPDEPFQLDFQFTHANGYLLQLQAKSIHVTAPGALSHPHGKMEGVIMDVTERAFLNKVLVQKEKLNTLGAMADEIAHEFRNPIFALGGFARRLKTKMPELPEAEIILEEAERLEQLLDRVKEYLKPVDVTRKPCSFNGIIQFCVELLRPRMHRNQIEPTLEIDPALQVINTDQDLLTQICMNLLNNAIEQLPHGGTLVIRSSESPQQQTLNIIVPSENGSPTNPEYLLLPFEQTAPSQSLAVSYRLVKNVDGLLAVQQEQSQLSFTLTLPTDV